MKKILALAIALIVSTAVFAQSHKHVVVTPGDTVVVGGVPATVVATIPIKTFHPKKHVRHGSGYLVRNDHPITIPTTPAPVWFNNPPAADSNKYAAEYYQRSLVEHDKNMNFILWIALAGVLITLLLAGLLVHYVLRNRPSAMEYAPTVSPAPQQVFHNYGGAGGAGGIAHGANASTRLYGDGSGNITEIRETTETMLLVVDGEESPQEKPEVTKE